MKKQALFPNLKVLELGSVLAIPAVGMFFAELGASVTKIENPKTGGDITRQWKLNAEDEKSAWSAYYASVNYGKTILFYDLSIESQRSLVLEMIADSDIVLSNFKPESAKKLGLDFESLRGRFPKLIYGQISGYGDERPAFDLLLQAETGYIAMNGSESGEPAKLPVAFIDLFAAHQLKEGLLTALLYRYQHGTGSYVHVSLYQAAIASLANQASNWLNAGHEPQPLGTLHPNIAPYGDTLQSSDGKKIILAVGSEKQFHALCTALKTEHLLTDKKFKTNKARVENRTELATLLNAAVKNQEADELLNWLSAHSVPVALITPVSEALRQYQLNHELLQCNFDIETSMKIVPTAIFDIEFNPPK